ncbi:serine/threonine-protein kinase [Inhella inkyongensis]|uniref:non-specific serine/threonine protein kinase n=1 Tax=Inhella inkyongensis TaxID=392593 RepID=A0A840RXW1_9BURK|nr:serine/threonine-protein kinase [Inhella inkyongensis]MBB5202775.1 serine/threonine-protein kinase [Inhella inkyongensis]
MGWLQRVKGWLGAGSSAAPATLQSTQPLTTQALGSTLPLGGQQVAAEVPAHIEIGAELGRGAMAVVHRAFDRQLGHEIAIKRLLLAQEYDPADLADVRARFLREARAARALNHPDILRVYDLGESGGDAWISMELLHGRDLSHHVQPGHLLPVAQVLRLGIRVARALDYAHRQGVVHRDIKPANIMWDAQTEQVKLMDFGIARIADGSRTRTGLVLGTPSFMAPEQLAGAAVDGRSDLYALGAVLYQLLTGRLPHQSESMARLMYEIANERVADVRDLRPGLPEALAMVLALALEKRPELRYANGEDFAQDLETVLAQLEEEPMLAAAPEAAAPPKDDPFGATQRIPTGGAP